MKRLLSLYLLLCLLWQVDIKAQDPHFSQYFTSPMTINPALTGKEVSDWRAGLNTRSQWWGGAVKPYYTMTASLEKSIPLGSNEQHYWGLGAMVVSDQSNGGLLKNNYFSLSAAYHLGLDGEGKHLLGAGLTGTYANRVLDPGKFQFQSQLGSMGFQRDIPSNDPVNVAKNQYFDVSAGLHYSYNGDRYGLSAGAALFHVATPREGKSAGRWLDIRRQRG